MPDDSLAGQFPATEWTLVLAAGADTSLSAPALEKLCGSYWQPLYAFARRKGHPPEVSADAVQGFLLTVIERRTMQNVERDARRFRAWLLGGFGHHLTNLHRHDQPARAAATGRKGCVLRAFGARSNGAGKDSLF